MTKLKHCPFCGGNSKLCNVTGYSHTNDKWYDYWTVECTKCEAKLSNGFQTIIRRHGEEIVIEKDGRADAIKAWNNRTKNDLEW